MQCISRRFLSHACYFSFGVDCIAHIKVRTLSKKSSLVLQMIFLFQKFSLRQRQEMWDKFMRSYSAFPLIISNLSSSTTNLQNSGEKFLSIRQPHTTKSTVTASFLRNCTFYVWFACLPSFSCFCCVSNVHFASPFERVFS